MRIRGDLRNTIQTISPHSTPPIGIESTMFFDFHSAGGVPPQKRSCPDPTWPPFYLPRQVSPNRSEPLSKRLLYH